MSDFDSIEWSTEEFLRSGDVVMRELSCYFEKSRERQVTPSVSLEDGARSLRSDVEELWHVLRETAAAFDAEISRGPVRRGTSWR